MYKILTTLGKRQNGTPNNANVWKKWYRFAVSKFLASSRPALWATTKKKNAELKINNIEK